MNKNDMRKNILNLRKQLSEPLATKASQAVTTAILELDAYKKAKKIAIYMAINHEVNLKNLWFHATQQQKTCYFPKVSNDYLHFLPGESLEQFTPNKWGILEPRAGIEQAIDINELDIIFLPLVAFDCTGSRIGMGKGYYDKTLQKSHNPILIGAAYEFQKVKKINAETWDIKLDIIVSESAIYYT